MCFDNGLTGFFATRSSRSDGTEATGVDPCPQSPTVSFPNPSFCGVDALQKRQRRRCFCRFSSSLLGTKRSAKPRERFPRPGETTLTGTTDIANNDDGDDDEGAIIFQRATTHLLPSLLLSGSYKLRDIYTGLSLIYTNFFTAYPTKLRSLELRKITRYRDRASGVRARDLLSRGMVRREYL